MHQFLIASAINVLKFDNIPFYHTSKGRINGYANYKYIGSLCV